VFVNIHLYARELLWLKAANHHSGLPPEQPAGAHAGRLSIFRGAKESWAGSPFTLNFIIIEESAENSSVVSTTLNND